jgi:hypothetical protein
MDDENSLRSSADGPDGLFRISQEVENARGGRALTCPAP